MPERTYSIEVRTDYCVQVDGATLWAWDDGPAAYADACREAGSERDARGYPPGDPRIQWPAIPAGVYVPPVPAPEAA